jgi:hypothetical protein
MKGQILFRVNLGPRTARRLQTEVARRKRDENLKIDVSFVVDEILRRALPDDEVLTHEVVTRPDRGPWGLGYGPHGRPIWPGPGHSSTPEEASEELMDQYWAGQPEESRPPGWELKR